MSWFSKIIGKDKRDLQKSLDDLKKTVDYLAKKKRENIIEDIRDLLNLITKDWTDNRYSDKVEIKDNYKTKIFIYTFENGNTFEINSEKLLFKDFIKGEKTTITLPSHIRNEIIEFVNVITVQINDGTAKKRYKETYKSKSKDPKRRKYETLLKTIIRRKDQLSNTECLESDRISLELELENSELLAKKMKNKYNY